MALRFLFGGTIHQFCFDISFNFNWGIKFLGKPAMLWVTLSNEKAISCKNKCKYNHKSNLLHKNTGLSLKKSFSLQARTEHQ